MLSERSESKDLRLLWDNPAAQAGSGGPSRVIEDESG